MPTDRSVLLPVGWRQQERAVAALNLGPNEGLSLDADEEPIEVDGAAFYRAHIVTYEPGWRERDRAALAEYQLRTVRARTAGGPRLARPRARRREGRRTARRRRASRNADDDGGPARLTRRPARGWRA